MEQFTVEKLDGALVVHCTGPVTFEHTARLKELVESRLDGSDYRFLVADLSQVTFMDSSGIGTLVALNSKAFSSQKKFYLMAPTEQVRKTLDLVKLSDFFQFLAGPEDLELLLAE